MHTRPKGQPEALFKIYYHSLCLAANCLLLLLTLDILANYPVLLRLLKLLIPLKYFYKNFIKALRAKAQ